MSDLVSFLEGNNISFEIIEHDKPIQTAYEGAAYFGIELGQTAPTLILKSEAEYYSIIISGDFGRIDLEDLKASLMCNELKLAKPKEVEQITGYTVGTVPLIGHGLPTVMDRQLKRYPFIYGGTGLKNATLKIDPSDVEKLNNVIGMIR